VNKDILFVKYMNNNYKYKRHNAHIIAYKNYINQSKQAQRNSHILWFKELQRNSELDQYHIKLRQNSEELIKKQMADKNIAKTDYFKISALLLSMNV
jgi:hypothetical protein